MPVSKTSKKLRKYQMWYKVNELFSKGLNKTQISLVVGLHRQTVRKYLLMSESEFTSSESFERRFGHKLDAYTDYVLGDLRRWPFLSAAQVHDHLREHFPDLPRVSEKTVFNFVRRLRLEHGLPKEGERGVRPYEKQPDLPWGEYAQADFGERWMEDSGGKRVKVYFFAICLCRSRYRFVHLSCRPYTTALAVYAHELAFEHFGGVPHRIMYDQDRVLLREENLGDLVLTRGFRQFVSEHGFLPVFCRKGDPESKGMVENLVGYVKHNFLGGRDFPGEDELNRQCLAWLGRTANGTEHHGTRRVPSEEFATEKGHLLPWKGVPAKPVEEMRKYHVRKDNVVTYHGNYYTVPTGTYAGPGTQVYLCERDGRLAVYDAETGKFVTDHEVCPGKGVLVRNSSHLRDRSSSLDELEREVSSLLPADASVGSFLSLLRAEKPRYYRDSLLLLRRRQGRYARATLAEAFSSCLEHRVLNANSLMQVAESLRIRKGEEPQDCGGDTVPHAEADTSGMVPEKTSMDTFNAIFQ